MPTDLTPEQRARWIEARNKWNARGANLMNPAGDPIVDERLQSGIPNFLTALVTGGPGVPGDIGQAAASGVTGLLNAQMQAIDPTGQARAIGGQHGLLQAPQLPFTSDALQQGLGGDPSAPESLLGFIGAPDITDVGKIAGMASKPGGLLLAQSLFHGTPHKFDRFALDSIGTGEGAQAFGHGLYFAENPGVANSYKNALSGRRNTTSLSDVMESFEVDGKRMIDQYPVEVDEELARLIDDQDWIVAKRHASERAKRWRELEADETYQFRDYAAEKADAWERLKPVLAEGKVENPSLGHLYEVEIPDEITERMLDWDAPLSEQPELKRIFDEFGLEAFVADADPTGGVVVREMENFFSQSKTGSGFEDMLPEAVLRNMDNGMRPDEAVSQYLREAGIPGIRFYDGSSRGKQARLPFQEGLPEGWRYFDDNGRIGIKDNKGLIHTDGFATEADAHKHLFGEKGTRNIVVFDPDDITQVKRDGELVFENKSGLKPQEGLLGEDWLLDSSDSKKTIIENVKNHHGVTDDYAEAGYILDDGDMLDFSGKNQGGPAGQRALDHREIPYSSDDPRAEYSATPNMFEFMERTNAVRFDKNSGIASANFKPNTKQLEHLESAFWGREIHLDFYSPKNGDVVASGTFDSPTVSEMRRFFREAYDSM